MWFVYLGQLQHSLDMGVKVVPDNTSHMILHNGSLIISDLTLEHEATYQCHVTDGVDEASYYVRLQNNGMLHVHHSQNLTPQLAAFDRSLHWAHIATQHYSLISCCGGGDSSVGLPNARTPIP